MAAATPATEVKRAKPSLNVYTGLLTIALLLAIFGATVISLMNMDASGQGPFDMITGR